MTLDEQALDTETGSTCRIDRSARIIGREYFGPQHHPEMRKEVSQKMRSMEISRMARPFEKIRNEIMEEEDG